MESREESLEKGQGVVFDKAGTKVAMYKDESGKLYRLSAKCMHRGCTVKWNGEENTRDCPCHGSRYKYDGTVIHGPAKKNLEKIKA